MAYPLEQAISAVQGLPESDQNMIASLIMAELADQEQWKKQFAEGCKLHFVSHWEHVKQEGGDFAQRVLIADILGKGGSQGWP